MTQSIPSKNIVLPRVDHINLAVKDYEESKKFYKQLFVDYLGGSLIMENEFVCGIKFVSNFLFEISPEDPQFATSKFNRYQVGLHHFAIELENKEAIDAIYQKLLELNVKIVDEPTFYPEYEDGYYAVFWEDLNGFKMEFMSCER